MFKTSHRMLLLLITLLFSSSLLAGEGYYVGAKKCEECHESEYRVWKATPHYKSYKGAHKTKEAKDILKAVGVKSMKRNKECALCHYTLVQKSASAKSKAKSGPSCESCHSPASEWLDLHSDYGDVEKAEQETPEHKVKRHAAMAKAGMIPSRMQYDIAYTCTKCHGLANPGLSADTLAAMMEAGHPTEPDFELVKYSQGKLRHRFLPQGSEKNKKRNPSELAQLFVNGQIATLVSATMVLKNAKNEKFKSMQNDRIAFAKGNLQKIAASVPEVKAFLAAPTEANGRKLSKSLEGKDLSSAVGSVLPAEKDYK